MSNSGQLYLENVDLKVDYTTEGTAGGVGFVLSGSNNEFDALTIAEGDTVACSSGSRVTFGGALNVNSSGQAVEIPEAGLGAGLVISGALIEMKDAASWNESKYQNHMGRNSATAIWNSTGIYSPNGGYLNYGWENMLWNAEARVNQDGVFRNTNLIAGGQLDANNRAIANSGSPTKLTIANGGTVSSSTNTYNVSKFSNRGGLFASSSAVTFDGSQEADFGDPSEFEITDTITIEVWIRPESTSGLQGIIGKVLFGGVSNKEWGLSSNGAKWFFKMGNGTTNGTIESDEDFVVNKWYHVACTKDSSGVMRMYVDGKLQSTVQTVTGDCNPEYDFIMGRRASSSDLYYTGTLGLGRIFNTERTGAQIRTDMFNAHGDMDSTTGLVACYQFDSGEGTSILDSTTNDLDSSSFDGSWANGGTWHAGNILSGSSANLYIGKGTYSTDFASSYYALENTYLISGAKWTSKAHSGSNDYYIDAGSGTTFNFSQIGNEPQPIVRDAVPPNRR